MPSGPRLSGQYRQTSISLEKEKQKGEIQLTERQLQILQSKRQTKTGIEEDKLGDQSIGDYPTTTAPTTSWGDSSSAVSAASSSSSFQKPGQQFYGQHLKGKQKLYDDTGASWHESRTQASSSSDSASNSAFKKQVTSSSTFDKIPSPNKNEKGESTESTSNHDYHAHHDRLLSTPLKDKPDRTPSTKTSESRHRRLLKSSTKKSTRSPAASEASSSFSADDRAFLRKVMQSYTNPGSSRKKESSSRKQKEQQDEAGSQVDSSSSRPVKKPSWKNRKSSGRPSLFSSAKSSSSSGSGSSTSQDKAILKRVLERARKKKQSSNPRKRDLLKSSSSRMKTLLSPKLSPKSGASETVGRQTSVDSAKKERSLHSHQTDEESRNSGSSSRGRQQKSLQSPTILGGLASSSKMEGEDGTISGPEDRSTQSDDKLQTIESQKNRNDTTSARVSVLESTSIAAQSLTSESNHRMAKIETHKAEIQSQSPSPRGQQQETKQSYDKDKEERNTSRFGHEQPSRVETPAGSKSVGEKRSSSSLENRRLGGTAATDTVKSGADSSVSLDDKANDQNERSASAGPDKAHDPASSAFSGELHLTQPGMERLGYSPKMNPGPNTGVNSSTPSHANGRAFPKSISGHGAPILTVHPNKRTSGEFKLKNQSSSATAEGYDDFLRAAEHEFRNYELKSTSKNQNILDIIYSDVPEGYDEFLLALQSEVSGAHTLLWSSFHCLFKGKDTLTRPLFTAARSNSQYPRTFSDKTKDTVANMSNYVKQTSAVRCVAVTQLVNDRMIKESAYEKPKLGKDLLNPHHTSDGGVSSQFTNGSKQYFFEPEDNDSDKENSAAEFSRIAAADSIDDDPSNDEFEVTLRQYARKSLGGQTFNNSDVETASDFFEHSLRQNSDDPVAPPEDITHDDQSKGTFQSTKAIEIVAPGQKRRFDPIHSVGSDVSIPWSGVKLRSIMDAEKSSTADDALPSSWARVKLRHVATKAVDEEDKNESGAQDIAQAETIIEESLTDPPPLPEAGRDSAAELSDRSHQARKSENLTIDTRDTTDSTAGVESQDTDKVDDTGVESQDTDKVDDTIVVPLCHEPGSSAGVLVKVVVGKNILMKIESHPGESKARVVWSLQRENVKSMTLDISSLQVRLLQTDGENSKDLAFNSAEDHMRFANALHEVTKPLINPAIEQNNSEDADDSIFVEQLSKEEQTVLEAYREQRRTKDPEDAMKESLSNARSKGSEESLQDKPPSVVDATGSAISSPMSSVSGALSIEEARVAVSYQKMLRLKVPKDAVQHKMMKDEIDPKIMGFVLGEDTFMAVGSASESCSELSGKEQQVAALYHRMLQLLIPPEAVRHKMEKENVDEKIVLAVLGKDKIEGNTLARTAAQLSGAEQAIADAYKKMLKMMIPKEAVEHKMRKDNVAPNIILIVLGGNPSNDGKSLSDEEESHASSYRQMLKLQIPKDAVRHKMRKEGVSEKIIAAVLGDKKPSRAVATRATLQPRNVKQGFHWDPLPSGEQLENSIWAKKKPMTEEAKPEAVDISRHIELFQKKLIPTEKNTTPKAGGSDKKDMVKLIDLNRANNVAISLKAFKEFSYKELSDIIEYLDPFQKVRGDRVHFIRDLLPSPPEAKAIKGYAGIDERLVPAELWFKQIVHVQRVEEKVSVLRAMETFKMESDALCKSFQLLTNVCRQVMSSEKLPDLLEMVRQIGNRMNVGRNEAAGFKLDFLPRLAQTKGTDKKTTALDLVVMIFAARDQREALTLLSDFPECHKASRILISDLIGDVKNLSNALRKCKKEQERLKSDQSSRDGKSRSSTYDSKSETGLQKAVPRLSTRTRSSGVKSDIPLGRPPIFEKRSNFMAALKGNTEQPKGTEGLLVSKDDRPSVGDLLKTVQSSSSDDKSECVSPRVSLLASLKEGTDETETSSGHKVNESTYGVAASITRVDTFFMEANVVFLNLESERDKAIEACRELSEFFCESGGEKATSALLGILTEFATNLDRAIKKYDEQQRKEERKQSTLGKKAKGSSVTKAAARGKPTDQIDEVSVSSGNKAKSLVYMVNEMLKAVGDKAKEDFTKGIDHENPDQRLKWIYEIEQQQRQKEMAPTLNSPPSKMNFLSTIEQRKHLHGRQDTEQALSELAQSIQRRASPDDAVEESDKSPMNRRLSPLNSEGTGQIDKRPGSAEAATSGLASILEKTTARPISLHATNESEPTEPNTPSNLDKTTNILSSMGGPECVATKNRDADLAKKRIINRWTSESSENTTLPDSHSEVDSPIESLKADELDLVEGDPKPALDRSGRNRMVERWTLKVEGSPTFEQNLKSDVDSCPGADLPLEQDIIVKTDSDILAADSHDSADEKILRKRREQYMDRWARNDDVKEASSADLEEDSDVGYAYDEEIIDKTRLRYMNRWASKVEEDEPTASAEQ
jgi:hypothetical protein